MADQGRREGGQEDGEHDDEARLEMGRQDEIDDAGGAEKFERRRDQLAHHDGRDGDIPAWPCG